MTETATAKQISYIADLEAKSGHTWTEYVNCPAGASLEQMPKAIASKVIDALKAECPTQPKSYVRKGATRTYSRGYGVSRTRCPNCYDTCCDGSCYYSN